MRMLLLALVLMPALLVGGQAQLTTLPPAYFVEITEPDPGEDVDGGETLTIEWENSEKLGFAAVYYSPKKGEWVTLQPCDKNAGEYDWDVPEADGEAEIRVEVYGSCSSDPVAEDSVSVDVVWEPPEDPCACHSCLECSQKLEGACATVYLAEDISSSSEGQCVNFDSSYKTFDCQGNEIAGGASSKEFYYAVMAGGNDNTIRNCVIREFEVGIDVHGGDDFLITNNTLEDNYGSGMFIADSSDIRVRENTIEGSGQGISIANSAGTVLEENRICSSSEGDVVSWGGVSGSVREDNTCDLIFNWNGDGDATWCDSVCNEGATASAGSGASLQGALGGEYGLVDLTGDIHVPGGLSVDTSHVTINCHGHAISGDGTGIGVLMQNRVNNELRDCVIEGFQTGAELRGTSQSRILSNEIRGNEYGLTIRGDALPSVGNDVSDNTIKPNSVYGLYLQGEARSNTMTGNRLGGGHYSFYTRADCDNELDESNTAGSGEKISYFHDDSGMTIGYDWGWDFGEIVLCGVSDFTFDGAVLSNNGSDGVVVLHSQDVRFRAPFVANGYQGFTIVNSSGIEIDSNQVKDHQKDCVSVSQCEDVQVSSMSLEGCDRGVALSFSSGCLVEDSDLSGMRMAGVWLYDSDSNAIEHNDISAAASNDSKGVAMLEGSSGNELYMNDIRGTGMGVSMDSGCDGNSLRENIVCENVMDIRNYGNNTGNANNCTMHSVWTDQGAGRGCYACCSEIRSDVDDDGIDDACDCADAFDSLNEEGVDCGGRCPECVECTWCDSSIEPVRIRGGPNDGYIDVVLVPMNDWGDYNSFVVNATKVVREEFLNLDKMCTDPLLWGYQDKFNFYFYKGGFGRNSVESKRCYNPEGPEGWTCIGGKGWLPGESEYLDWLYECSALCAATLGLGCGCFAYEPNHYWNHASFTDVAGIISSEQVGGTAGFGPTNHFKSALCQDDSHGNIVIHETGHALFSVTDTYCGDTAYHRAGTAPNVWGSLAACQNAEAFFGWTDGECVEIWHSGSDCPRGLYRYDANDVLYDVMDITCGDNARFKEACTNRINHVLTNWGSGGSKGIINYIEMHGANMSHLMSRVVPNHPDLGKWVPDFPALTQSAGGKPLDEFSFSDPRVVLYDNSELGSGETFLNDTYFSLTVPMHDNVRWLHIFNGSSGEESIVVDMGPAIWNYCENASWEDEYCRTVDLNDNGKPDYLEEWGLEDAMWVMGGEAPGAEAPDVEGEPYAPPEEPELEVPAEPPGEGAAGPEGDGGSMTQLMVIILAIAAFASVAYLARKKRAGKSKPGKEAGGKSSGEGEENPKKDEPERVQG